MKKIVPFLICVLLSIILFFFCFNYNKNNYPNELYNVYLDGKYLGLIDNKEALEEYIDKKSNHIVNMKNITKTYCDNDLESLLETEELKELLQNSKSNKRYTKDNKECIDINIEDGSLIDKIYSPNGLIIEKTLTYKNNLSSIEEIYNNIINLKSLTVDGYQFTIKKENGNKYIYVLNKEDFEKAVKELIKTYAGDKEYQLYETDSQLKIDTVGSLLENVYIEEDITVKKMRVSMDKEIYTSYQELASFLLYGDSKKTKTYKVKEGEMISDIALANEISKQEFLISNPKYKNENSLIKSGTEVIIKETNPQLNVVLEKFIVEDKENKYKTVFQYDDNQYAGYEKVIQEGESGLERISNKQKIINGNIVFVQPVSKQSLKPTVNRIVVKGDKIVPNIGDLHNWAWPSESGWVISDDYGYRLHPILNQRQFHRGLDIAGNGYNSAVYAANNGTIIKREYYGGYGNTIVINHNNGYYTLYAHMNKFYPGLKLGDTVSRGQQIGYVGSTGRSNGPHIHFEVWKGGQNKHINPWVLYR